MNRWDPNALKLDKAFAGQIEKVSRRKRRMLRRVDGLFLRGPIPMGWLHNASKLGASALWVGCVLWHLSGVKKSTTFLVSNLHLHRWGVDRFAKSRALKALSGAGLIALERHGKRSPKVTIIPVEQEERGLTEAPATTALGRPLATLGSRAS
jgi:hypothetical protein